MQRKLELMATSVTSPYIKGKDIVIYSKCLFTEHPDIFENVTRSKAVLGVCMSEEHLDKVGFKIATIMAYARPSSITILTMDGSPHCTQLHAIAEQAKTITRVETKIVHLVVEKGELMEVSTQTVYLSRHLSKIEELLKNVTKKNL